MFTEAAALPKTHEGWSWFPPPSPGNLPLTAPAAPIPVEPHAEGQAPIARTAKLPIFCQKSQRSRGTRKCITGLFLTCWQQGDGGSRRHYHTEWGLGQLGLALFSLLFFGLQFSTRPVTAEPF